MRSLQLGKKILLWTLVFGMWISGFAVPTCWEPQWKEVYNIHHIYSPREQWTHIQWPRWRSAQKSYPTQEKVNKSKGNWRVPPFTTREKKTYGLLWGLFLFDLFIRISHWRGKFEMSRWKEVRVPICTRLWNVTTRTLKNRPHPKSRILLWETKHFIPLFVASQNKLALGTKTSSF